MMGDCEPGFEFSGMAVLAMQNCGYSCLNPRNWGGKKAKASTKSKAYENRAHGVGGESSKAEVTDSPKGADSSFSRSGAFKEAKQKARVPRSQHPDKVYREKIRDQEGHIDGRVYEFKMQDGSTVTIREHSLGHVLGNHGPHFNSEVRDSAGIKQPLDGNGDSHTYFRR